MVLAQARWPAGVPTGGQFRGGSSSGMGPGELIDRKAAQFYENGGQIVESDYGARASAHRDLKDMAEYMDIDYADPGDNGWKFTKYAMSSDEGYIAVVDGAGVAGAIGVTRFDHDSYADFGYESATLYIDYLGTTGIADGTGSTLFRRVLQDAYDGDYAIALSPSDASAAAFWSKMGFKAQEEGMTMSAAKVQSMMNRMRG